MSTLIDNHFCEVSVENKLGIIEFKDDVFDFLSSLKYSQIIIDFIKEAEYDKQVRGILLISRDGCLGEKAYDAFLRRIAHQDSDLEISDSSPISEKLVRFREINILAKFIKFLGNYQKLVVVGISTEIVTPFIGSALVADMRLASPNAVFSMYHHKFGLHPSGGIPFFLDRFIGHSKAIELQFSDRINVETAFRLGLIDQVLPDDEFKDACIRYLQPYLTICPSTLRLTKRLNNFSYNQLTDYFDFEAGLLNL